MTYEEASHARCHLMVTTTAIETSWCHSTYTYSTRRGYAAVIRGRNNRYKPWYMQTNLNSGDFAITWISVICCALGAQVDIKLYMSRVRRVLLAILPYIYFSLFMALWRCVVGDGSVVAAITRCVWRRPLGATRTPVGPAQSKRHVQPCTRLSSHRCPPCYGMYGSGQFSYSDPEQAGLELDRGHLRDMSHEVNLGNLFGGWKRQNKKKDNDWSKLSSSFFLVWRVPLWLAYVLSSAGQVGIICWFYAENLPILCQKFAHFTVLQRMKIPDRVRSWRIECLQNSLFYCQNGYWFLFLSSWSLNPTHMPLFFIFDVITL